MVGRRLENWALQHRLAIIKDRGHDIELSSFYLDTFSFLENKNGKYNFILNKIYAIVSNVKGLDLYWRQLVYDHSIFSMVKKSAETLHYVGSSLTKNVEISRRKTLISLKNRRVITEPKMAKPITWLTWPVEHAFHVLNAKMKAEVQIKNSYTQLQQRPAKHDKERIFGEVHRLQTSCKGSSTRS